MKKEIKLIALDLDGTLLTTKKELSERNREALRRCAEQGIEIVPCTGRIWAGVPEFVKKLPGVHYAITVNGAVVEDVVNHCVIDERKMSLQTALEILEMAKEYRTMYDAYVGGRGYGEARFMDHMDDYGIPEILQNMILQTRQPVENLMAEIRKMGILVDKINYFFSDSQERLRAKAALDARGDVIVTSSFSNNLEINGLGATKGEAIARLADYLGLAHGQTMGFGDGDNDMTMMTMSGIGVAMGNAVDSLKEKADYVTVSNDEDGVAAALEHFLWS